MAKIQYGVKPDIFKITKCGVKQQYEALVKKHAVEYTKLIRGGHDEAFLEREQMKNRRRRIEDWMKRSKRCFPLWKRCLANTQGLVLHRRFPLWKRSLENLRIKRTRKAQMSRKRKSRGQKVAERRMKKTGEHRKILPCCPKRKEEWRRSGEGGTGMLWIARKQKEEWS